MEIVLKIINTVFEENVADFGGAIYALSFDLEIDNCTFEDNKANGIDDFLLGGGAIVVCPGDFDVDIKDSLFSRNSAIGKGASGRSFTTTTQFPFTILSCSEITAHSKAIPPTKGEQYI